MKGVLSRFIVGARFSGVPVRGFHSIVAMILGKSRQIMP
jgi:hypothetical protein